VIKKPSSDEDSTKGKENIEFEKTVPIEDVGI
jgi:hypothetical protein